MKAFLVLCLSTAVFLSTSAWGAVYKCVSDDGVTTYSDQPCGNKAEIVIETTDFSVDEAIGNASPYTEPVTYSLDIGADILLHARKVGKSILPEKEFDRDRIELKYIGEPRDDRIFVKLTFISIKRFDWATPLPTLRNAKKLKKYAHYGWYVTP